MLRRSDFKTVEVKLLNPQNTSIPALFPQPLSTSSIRLYESVRDRLVALLFQYLGMSWVSMSLYRLGSFNMGTKRSEVYQLGTSMCCTGHDKSYLLFYFFGALSLWLPFIQRRRVITVRWTKPSNEEIDINNCDFQIYVCSFLRREHFIFALMIIHNLKLSNNIFLSVRSHQQVL